MRDSQRPMLVDESRAAALLGLSASELRRLSAQAGLGKAGPVFDEGSGSRSDSAPEIAPERRVFTYAELYRLCRVAVQSAS